MRACARRDDRDPGEERRAAGQGGGASSKDCSRRTSRPERFSRPPNSRAGGESVFLELARRQGDYASVGIAAHRRSAEIRLAFFAVGPTAILATHAAAAARKSVAAAQEALAQDLDPPADLYHSGATKLHLARVLLGRALAQWNMK
jgi:carbon-monoxide dehydrogenase medium subunit